MLTVFGAWHYLVYTLQFIRASTSTTVDIAASTCTACILTTKVVTLAGH